MRPVLDAPFIRALCETTRNIYRLGWAERNGGNISVRLDEQELAAYLDTSKVLRTMPTGFDARPLAGMLFLVTGTGVYFKNVAAEPERSLGILRIAEDGVTAELLWGLSGGGRFTSELPAHLMSHMARLAVDPGHRVVLHTHPTHTIAMSSVCPPDERAVTRALWQSNTECILVFPEGVGVLPWMVCGTNEIGAATAEKMREYRLVLWTNHGIYGAGASLDEAFGLVETVEKTARIFLLSRGFAERTLITDPQLKDLAAHFGLTPRAGILE